MSTAAATAPAATMTKTQAIRAIIEAAATAPVVFTTGYTSRIAHGIRDRPNHFYLTGSMGLCAPVATGVALATGRPAVAVDGDGSVLMNPGAFVIAGALAPLPLIHVVLDDGAYESTGGQPTGSGGVDLGGWARGSAYAAAYRPRTVRALADLVARHIADGTGPVLLHCLVRRAPQSPPARLDADLAGYARRFGDHLSARDARRFGDHLSARGAGPTSSPIDLDSDR